MKEIIISLRNVTKTFQTKERSFTTLHSINFNIYKGDYLAIVGKSGSGKSTLLNMITGIDFPSSGEVWINGTDIGTLNESKLAKWRGKNIGIVFQFFQLIPTLTIAENLMLAMEFVNIIPKKERAERVSELLTLVGISDQANKMPATLSGGEQQRAAIARSLVNDPEIIVADEPTGNLDSATAEAVHRLLQSLNAAGKTVIVVTHEQENQLSRYDRILKLSDGKIMAEPLKTTQV